LAALTLQFAISILVAAQVLDGPLALAIESELLLQEAARR
jgi:hypothetical protein